MSTGRTVALGVVAWVALGTGARADTLWSSDGAWVYFVGGSRGSTLRSQYPNLFSGPTASVPATTSAPTTPPAAPVLATLTSPSVTAADHTSFSGTTTGSSTADAYLNFGTSYPEASQLTTGNAQPWYSSPSVTKFFNGNTPNPDQQADFTRQVLDHVQHTFNLSGLNPTLTLDPSGHANHTLSVVSGANYGPNPNAIGITDVGHNGFGFIDKLSYAKDLNELEWAVAHNVSHELMHAFGVGSHPDSTGGFVDAGTASWPLLTNPNSAFSPEAVKAINDAHFAPYGGDLYSKQIIEGEQEIVAPVPEPTTIAVWAMGAVGAVIARRGRARRTAA